MPYRTILRAAVATRNDEIRDYLTVHLQDRGFVVEPVHRSEYMLVAAPGATLLIADITMLREAGLRRDQRANELIVLSQTSSAEEAVMAAADGALEYFAVPFESPRRLATLLDEVAERGRARGKAEALEAQAALAAV